ncbi:MAG: histidinol-phosphate transaminase [Candidatus Neomarinimicrobiota bacterium]
MPLVPIYIKNLAPYQAGKPANELAGARIVKLDSNENPLGPSPRALAAARQSLGEAHRYPDQSATELRALLAKRFDVRLENVITGAGSEGIMSTIMRTFLCDDDELISARGTFIGFRVLADASGRRTHWVPMKDYRYDLPRMAVAINENTKIIYLANPDNPTGTYFTIPEFDAFMALVPERVVVLLDEAYFEYAQGRSDYPDSMHYRYDNVITLRTFSKAHGLAGLRVGYGFAYDELIGNLLKVKLAFEPSRPALAAALAALEDREHLEATLESTRRGMERLTQAFHDLGLDCIPSAANFVTLILPTAKKAAGLVAGLHEQGVFVRHLAAFGWPELVRVTVGSEEENRYLVTALSGEPFIKDTHLDTIH